MVVVFLLSLSLSPHNNDEVVASFLASLSFHKAERGSRKERGEREKGREEFFFGKKEGVGGTMVW